MPFFLRNDPHFRFLRNPEREKGAKEWVVMPRI